MLESSQTTIEQENMLSVEVRKIGEFNSAHTPFDISINEVELAKFIVEEVGIAKNDLQNIIIQFAASDISTTQGLSHPLSKIEAAVSFKSRLQNIGGLTDHRLVDGKRTVTIFIGKLFEFWCEALAQGIDYNEDPNFSHTLIRQEKAREKFIELLRKSTEEEKRRLIGAISLYLLKIAGANITAHELIHVKQMGFSAIKNFLLQSVTRYGLPVFAPIIGANLIASLVPSDYSFIFSMLGLSVGMSTGAVGTFGLMARQEHFEKEAYPFGVRTASDENRNRWLKILKITPDARYFEAMFEDV